MKKILFIVVLVLLTLSFSSAAFADEAYDITDYDVHIVVSEDNVLDVVERLTLNYSLERHGFFYFHHFRGEKVNVVEGEVVRNKFWHNIKDINVIGHKYKKSTETYGEDKYIKLQIGDPNATVIGEQEYVITYKSEISDDNFTEFDEFYQDIAFCDYGDTIEKASFIIEFPKNIDKDEVHVYLGEQYEDTNGSRDVYFEVGNDTIKGYTLRPMTGGEILTVRVQMEEGYFSSVRDPYLVWKYIIFGVTGGCVLLAFLLWIAFGRDKKVFPTVEFYPPDGMSSAEAGYIIDGTVDNKDIISMIIYWADKGYIKITEKSKTDIELERHKILPADAKKFEKSLFKDLFATGAVVNISTYKNTFYTSMESAKVGVRNYFESSKSRRVFTVQSKKARTFMGLLTMLPIALSLFMFIYFTTAEIFWTVFVAVVVSVFISLPVFMLVRLFERWRSTERGKKVAKMIFSFVLLGSVFFGYLIGVPLLPVFDSLKLEFKMIITLVTSLATMLLMALAAIMRKRTDVGSSWYGKLLGFREFIDKAEKDRIQRLVDENPSYFYSVLPYAYVLGVTDKWAKKFEGINMQSPSWYYGYNATSFFTTTMFVRTMTRSMSHIQSVATSKPTSSGSGGFSGGGGGFSGGGFSGGGGGGGGAGGSW